MQAVVHLRRPLGLDVGLFVRADELRGNVALAGEDLEALALEVVDLRGFPVPAHADVAEVPQQAVPLQSAQLIGRARPLHAGGARKLIDGEEAVALDKK